MNLVALVGRLTRDPELRYTPNGVATATFTLAVDDPFGKDGKKADFINIVAWRQTADNCAKYLKKGRLCAVEGRISTRDYEKDGRKIYVTEVVANHVKFLERAEQSTEQKQNDPFKDDGKPLEFDDDDLPF